MERTDGATAEQQLRDVDVELGSGRRLEQCAELTVVARCSQPAPVLQHVDFGALGERRSAFTKERRSTMRPRGNHEPPERAYKPCVMRINRFVAHAESGATFELTLEARPGAPPIESESPPAQAMLHSD